MNNQGIGSWTARRARKTPNRTALIHEDRAISYADLHDSSTRLAHALRSLGVAKGDRVAFLGPNHPSFLLTLFACGQLGAVFLPLNTRLAPAELRYQLADSGTRTLLYVHGDPAGLNADNLIEAELQAFDDLLSASPAESIDEPVALDDLCMIMYTSGTTGRPKGSLLTHGNITWNSLNVIVDVDISSDEVTLVSAPLFHTAALNMTCLPTLLKGGTAVLEPSFDPARVLKVIDRHKITCLFGVPSMFDMLAAAPGFAQADLSTVRNLLCGGAPVPARTIRQYLDRGLQFVQGYGMTEASPGVLLLDRRDVVEHAGTAGVPHFFTDVRLSGPPDEPREIEVSGPHVSAGYWGASPRPDQWFRTGDLAVDEGGYIRLVDRLSDMYISGGENVYPAEVEDAVLAHPGVAECAVFGVPDEQWGESGRAVVVARPGFAVTAQDVLDHLNGRLARYKIPKSVVFTDSLPRSGAGKILKRPLRDRYGGLPMQTTVAELAALAGTDLGESSWIEITQDRVNTFADATGDHQWIHVDAERAAAGPFGGTIAHGFLTLSLLIPMFYELLQVQDASMTVNYGLNKVRFPAPVRVGARIRAHGVIAEVTEVKDGVQMAVDFTVEIDGAAKPACAAQGVYRFYA